MASLRMLKGDLYRPFGASKSSSRRLSNTGIVKFDNTKFIVCCRNQYTNEISGEEPPESLFMKELKRRGMTPTSLPDNKEEIMYKEEDGLVTLNQREQSMALNSEGLEGLIPRGSLLLRLGGTFFLAFWPLILVTVASFSAIYLYLGPKFVHDGTAKQVQLPQYIDPYELLQDERISQTSPILN